MHGRPAMHRLFVAIRPPEHVVDLLVDAMDDSPELRWVSDENLHLTLRFIGEVERPLANELAAALATVRFASFQMRVSGAGSFDRRGGGAIWAGVEPRTELRALAAKVDRSCVPAGLPPERRAFHPHITLARYGRDSKQAAAHFLRRTSALASGPFRVDSFMLFESRLSRHGPHYEAIGRFPLV